jgi:hypothetical protein
MALNWKGEVLELYMYPNSDFDLLSFLFGAGQVFKIGSGEREQVGGRRDGPNNVCTYE